MEIPETKYAKTADGANIANQVFGESRHDLVVLLPWLSNVDACWDVPDFAALLRGFGRYARAEGVDSACRRACAPRSRAMIRSSGGSDG